MRFNKLFLFLLSVAAGFAVVFIVARISGITMDAAVDAAANEVSAAVFETKTIGSLDDGDVEIALTPQIADKKLIVKVGMNTHSVNLGQFDLATITTLEYEGKIIRPTDAKKPGGHHSYGKIVFDIGEERGSFTIRIAGIPRIQDRIYEWSSK